MKRYSVTSLLIIMFVGALSISPVSSMAQEGSSDNMEILREKLRADKKLLVAANMQLAEAEGKAFWPIYDEYQKEKSKLADRRLKVIQEYAANFNNLTPDVAKKLVEQSLAIQKDDLKLMESHLAKLRKVLSEIKVGRFYQIENKIGAILDFELARSIPLAE